MTTPKTKGARFGAPPATKQAESEFGRKALPGQSGKKGDDKSSRPPVANVLKDKPVRVRIAFADAQDKAEAWIRLWRLPLKPCWPKHDDVLLLMVFLADSWAAAHDPTSPVRPFQFLKDRDQARAELRESPMHACTYDPDGHVEQIPEDPVRIDQRRALYREYALQSRTWPPDDEAGRPYPPPDYQPTAEPVEPDFDDVPDLSLFEEVPND